jgi:molybdopterin-guanine dinucleotide biosynthesis protein A
MIRAMSHDDDDNDDDNDDVTLCILAGGEGRRMGRPKGELRIGDVPILQYLLDRFAWLGPTMLITAPGREHPPAWEMFDREVVDPVAGLGPLRGLLTALEQASTPIIVVTTVDMPGIGRPQLDFVVDHLCSKPNRLGVMTQRAIDDLVQIEPFPSAFRIDARHLIAQELAAQRRSVHRLSSIEQFDVLDVPIDWPESVWTNLNTPDDLR